MKQKSMSVEGMSLTLDHSGSTSDGGWPTSNSSSGTNTNLETQVPSRCRNINRQQPEFRQNADVDFSINWVKADYYSEGGNEAACEVPKISKTFKPESVSSISGT